AHVLVGLLSGVRWEPPRLAEEQRRSWRHARLLRIRCWCARRLRCERQRGNDESGRREKRSSSKTRRCGVHVDSSREPSGAHYNVARGSCMSKTTELRGARAVIGAMLVAITLSCSSAEKPRTGFTSAGRGAAVSPAIPWEMWRNAADI